MTTSKKLAAAALAGLFTTCMVVATPAFAADEKASCNGKDKAAAEKKACNGKDGEKASCKGKEGEKAACKGKEGEKASCKGKEEHKKEEHK